MATNRWRNYFIALLTITLVESIVFTNYHQDINAQRIADRRIIKGDIETAVDKLKAGELSYLTLSEITRFDWDKFYVFGAYSSESYIDSVLEISWPWTIRTFVDSNDGVSLLVFTRQGKVVQYMDYGRSEGDFSSLIDWGNPIDYSSYSEYTYQNAIFSLDDNGRFFWVNEQ